MNETAVREIVRVTMSNRGAYLYSTGALERIMASVDLSLGKERLLAQIERLMKNEEQRRA